MPKGSIDRLNETLDHIPKFAKSYPDRFTGLSASKLREHLLKTLRDDPYLDLNEISEDIALGGGREISLHYFSETALRHLKRFTLLLHRVMCYHSSAQTRLYKTQLMSLDEAKTLAELTLQLSRGVRLMFDPLHGWLLKTLPEDGGALVHYYNQADDQRLKAMDITEGGWCLGVSTQWVRFKATGRTDFWTWMRTPEGAAAMRFVMAAQGVRTSGGHDLSDRASFALARFGVIQEQVLTCGSEQAATPNAMANNITSSGRRYCRIGQGYVTGGGHAMAGANGNAVYFMDPNAGEMMFTSGPGLSSWLPKFVRRMGYHFSRHYVELYSYQPSRARVDTPKAETLEDTMRDAMAKRRKAMGY
jgi:hypothetical protein